tara:strand:+ start:83 stop:781 length:699 start_codon:yes stop_codon:yes gene_type:complete
VCAGDPNKGAREQAKIRAQEKNAAFKDAGTVYWNKEVSYLNSNQRAVIGLSRTYGDIMEAGIRQRGVLRGQSQLLANQYYAINEYASKASEAGRSRTAGKRRYADFLTRKTILENQLRNTTGANAYKRYLGANRQYRAQLAGNRESLGLPPTYGSPVMIPPKGDTLMANIGLAATVAGAILTGGSSIAAGAAAKGATTGLAGSAFWTGGSAAAWGAGLSAGGYIFSSQAGGY